jgi:signal peptidase I
MAAVTFTSRFPHILPVVASLGFAALVAVVGLRTFAYQPFNIPTVSMSPSLNAGDYLLVSKFAYNAHDPQRGDIIVFHVPALGDGAYVKRIVGLPGERIQMRNGIVFINGVPAQQRRVADFLETDDFGAVQHVPQFAETLPGGRIDLILDRGASAFDNTDEVAVPPGSYFVLGDNRDNSDDSRGTEGFVARAQIVGPPAFKYIAGGRLVWQPVN